MTAWLAAKVMALPLALGSSAQAVEAALQKKRGMLKLSLVRLQAPQVSRVLPTQ